MKCEYQKNSSPGPSLGFGLQLGCEFWRGYMPFGTVVADAQRAQLHLYALIEAFYKIVSNSTSVVFSNDFAFDKRISWYEMAALLGFIQANRRSNAVRSLNEVGEPVEKTNGCKDTRSLKY